MLANRPRLYDLMEQRQLDALVALLPIHVYYLTDYWSLFMEAGFDAVVAAVFPRDGAGPVTLIIPAGDIRDAVDSDSVADDILTYTDLPPATDDRSAPGSGAPYVGSAVRPGVPLSARQQRWAESIQRLTASPSATSIHAIGRALHRHGLARGRIGIDDERLGPWLADAGCPDATIVEARDLFNTARLVKTDAEIDLLRLAARKNERAVETAMRALREGAVWPEIEAVYMTAMAQQDARGTYLTCGSGGLQTGRVVPGEAVMFDGLGTYRHYHGDFGRSAVVGAPGADVEPRVRALEQGWREVCLSARPGVRYYELADRVATAVRAAGFGGNFRRPVVHSLGLQHTDDVTPRGSPVGRRPDTVLQSNMVLNVDMPHLEIGWGAVHLEDTIRITADGCEPLTSLSTGLWRP